MRKGWTLVARFSAGDWKTQGSRVGVRTVPSLGPDLFSDANQDSAALHPGLTALPPLRGSISARSTPQAKAKPSIHIHRRKRKPSIHGYVSPF